MLSEPVRAKLIENYVYVTDGLGAPHWSFRQFTQTPVLAIFDDDSLFPCIDPTNEEIEMLASYVRAESRFYSDVKEGCAKGFNTTIVRKMSAEKWMYRSSTWSQGPTFFPWEGMPLKQLMLEHITRLFLAKYDKVFQKKVRCI
jgi:hypothetical protein